MNLGFFGFDRRADVCIGVPVHNGARHLRQALDSLLAQSFRDFRLFAYDDGSSDGSWEILKEYAARDRRMSVDRARGRTGMTAAWRHVAHWARKRCRPRYFAWHSDHDWVKSDWLKSLLTAMQADPKAVLVHAWSRWVDDAGNGVEAPPPVGFDTTGLDRWQRLSATVNRPLGAGDAVYGLFRMEPLERCGYYRDEILPDQLLISEIQLYGHVRYVAEKLRFRRVGAHTPGADSELIGRQLRSLFPDGTVKTLPLTSFATCFLRELSRDAALRSVELLPARMFHAALHVQRSAQRFHKDLRRELGESRDHGPMRPWTDLMASQLDRPAMVPWSLYHEVMEKLAGMESQPR